jgi:hypothetical protein
MITNQFIIDNTQATESAIIGRSNRVTLRLIIICNGPGLVPLSMFELTPSPFVADVADGADFFFLLGAVLIAVEVFVLLAFVCGVNDGSIFVWEEQELFLLLLVFLLHHPVSSVLL